jgi:predicted ester cyclase
MSVKEIMEKERWATEEAILKGNFDAIDEAEVFHPDATFHRPPFPDLKGLEAFKKGLMGFGQAITDIQWNWDEVIIEGSTAAQRFTMRGKHTGTSPDFPAPPTGKDVIMEGCAFYHVKNGEIVEFTEYSNYFGFLQQIDVIPPMEQGGH